ncbi:MAG: LPXTG cell wall anchor domain-containing protein [Bacillota bacterium]|nr:LPXTG cell wall anchor domain-containing protein [Bacillota bacterium]
MKNRHKLLSIILTLCMVIGMIPITTSTANADSTISRVDIDSIIAPVVGAIPNHNPVISTPGVSVGENTFWVVYDSATESFYDVYEDTAHVDTTPFRVGESYALQIMMEADFDPEVEVYYKGTKLSEPDPFNMYQSAAIYTDDGVVIAFITTGELTDEPADNPTDDPSDNPTDVPSDDPGDVPKEDPKDGTPETGDDSNMMIWLALMILAATGAAGTVMYRRKA